MELHPAAPKLLRPRPQGQRPQGFRPLRDPGRLGRATVPHKVASEARGPFTSHLTRRGPQSVRPKVKAGRDHHVPAGRPGHAPVLPSPTGKEKPTQDGLHPVACRSKPSGWAGCWSKADPWVRRTRVAPSRDVPQQQERGNPLLARRLCENCMSVSPAAAAKSEPQTAPGTPARATLAPPIPAAGRPPLLRGETARTQRPSPKKALFWPKGENPTGEKTPVA